MADMNKTIISNQVYLEQQLCGLTSCIVKTTSDIDRARKLFSKCEIVLDETETTEFILALTKLFEQINQCEKRREVGRKEETWQKEKHWLNSMKHS